MKHTPRSRTYTLYLQSSGRSSSGMAYSSLANNLYLNGVIPKFLFLLIPDIRMLASGFQSRFMLDAVSLFSGEAFMKV